MCGGFWANREKLLLSIPAGLPFEQAIAEQIPNGYPLVCPFCGIVIEGYVYSKELRGYFNGEGDVAMITQGRIFTCQPADHVLIDIISVVHQCRTG
jgi:hypothetical protein